MNPFKSRGFELGCAVSVGLHAGLWTALGAAPVAAPERRAPAVFEIAQRLPEPPPAPPPEPQREPEPSAPEPVRAVAARTEAAPGPPPAAPAEPAPAADLTGITLTNDSGGASWSSAVGSGAPLKGPIGLARELPRTAPSSAPPPRPAAPELVAAANLSERPRPPALDGVLRRHYPPDARRVGLSGQAAVLARIDPDGVARAVRVVSESGAGFGEACRRTLAGSRWSAPRDRSGHAVATEVRYTCRFQVD